ncbi:hypothetical protein [Streptomyces sp. NPDC059176]|uniref:hypothetical protein n=1 Tax=unclassified Streptomyces TaxID=2593676 RepID=UPI00367A9D76
MLRTVTGLLSRRHGMSKEQQRLDVPPGLSATLGCDAVGLPAGHGVRLLARMPHTGCVYADADWWWWIVPSGSDLDLPWPLPAHYSRGAYVPVRSGHGTYATAPRLIHRPDSAFAYTPPIPLYLMVCQITGIAPAWARHGFSSTREPEARESPASPRVPGRNAGGPGCPLDVENRAGDR